MEPSAFFIYAGFAILAAHLMVLEYKLGGLNGRIQAHRDMMEEMINAMEEVDRLHNLDMDRLAKNLTQLIKTTNPR